MSKQTCVSCAKMVILSKAQLKNKKIEGVIQNLWELSKQNVEFKLELTLEYGSLLLDNQKMSTLEEKEGLAAACLRKYIEIEKLPNPLSKMTQIQAYNWLQTQIRLDQKVVMGSILKDRVTFGTEESRPSFWNDDILPWTSVTKTFKNLHVDYPSLVNKVKAMIGVRLKSLGKNPETYVADKDIKETEGGEEATLASPGATRAAANSPGVSSSVPSNVDNQSTKEGNVLDDGEEATLASPGAARATTKSPGVSSEVPTDRDNQGKSLEGNAEDETILASPGATRATTNSPGASSKVPSDNQVQADISLDANSDSRGSSSLDESDPDESMQLLSKKRKLQNQLKTAMLALSTTSNSSEGISTTENSPAKQKGSLQKKCKDCKFIAKTKGLLDVHIKSKHPFNIVGCGPSEPRKSKRPRKSTKRDSHIYESEWDA